MVENGVGKVLYKIELLLIKTIPYIIMFCYVLNTVLSYFNIDLVLWSVIGGISVLPYIFLYISSFVFRFCFYHRLPLYYILISNCIMYYDNTIGIPVTDKQLFVINAAIIGIFILLLVFIKYREHEQKTS